VRVIAATNKDIALEVNTGNFRKDLYWRLNVINIDIPPLIQRSSDISLLANHFISKHNRTHQAGSYTLSKEVSQIFSKYSWPGNVRELENVIERALVFTNNNIIEKGDLPDHLQTISALPQNRLQDGPLAKSEKSQIIEVLTKSNFNISLSAKVLRISRNTLYNKIEKYNIDSLAKNRKNSLTAQEINSCCFLEQSNSDY
jgi:transcriptional regulator with PAS, ATPase and Fis domain